MVIEEAVRLTRQKLTQQRSHVNESQNISLTRNQVWSWLTPCLYDCWSRLFSSAWQLNNLSGPLTNLTPSLQFISARTNWTFELFFGYISGLIKMFNRRFVRSNLTLILWPAFLALKNPVTYLPFEDLDYHLLLFHSMVNCFLWAYSMSSVKLSRCYLYVKIFSQCFDYLLDTSRGYFILIKVDSVDS